MTVPLERPDTLAGAHGERARRELARELGSGVVQSLYRLLKSAQIHALDNQAVRRGVDALVESARDYHLRTGVHFNVLFARSAIFVAGQPLKATRAVYESASELAQLFARCGGSDLRIAGSVTAVEVQQLVAAVMTALRDGRARFSHPKTPRLSLRSVSEAAVLRGLEIERLSSEQRIVRTYASAVVVLRRFFEQLAKTPSDLVLPKRIKHIAQDLVDLSAGKTPEFLGVTAVRNANHDDAGKAVNTAILAVSMARLITEDRIALTRIAMSAMLHDVGRPRALRGQKLETDEPTVSLTMRLGEEGDRALPAGTAAVLTALGRVNEPSIARSVIVYETLWLARKARLGPVYRGMRPPTLAARIVAMARRYNELLTPGPGEPPRSSSDVLLQLDTEVSSAPGTGKAILGDGVERTVLRLLIGALGVMPPGTLVELSTGEIAVVVGAGDGQATTFRIVLDEAGGMPERPIELTLSGDDERRVVKIVGSDPSFVRRAEAEAANASPAPPMAGAPSPPVARTIASSPLEGESTLITRTTAGSASIEAPGIVELAHLEDDVPHAPASEPPTPSSYRPPPLSVRPAPTTPRPPPPSSRSMRTAPAVFAPPAPPTLPPPPQRKAEVRGTLATSPVPHLLVHVLSRALTGTLIVRAPDGAEHAVYFDAGAPRKLRPAVSHLSIAPLGAVLVERGALTEIALESALEGARAQKKVLGKHLIDARTLDLPTLQGALRSQLLARLVALASTPDEGTYEFYLDADLLRGWAGDEVIPCDPLAMLLGVVREWNDDARIDSTLKRLGDRPLTLHPASDLSRFGLTAEERAVIDAALEFELHYESLLEAEVAPPAVVRSLIYALAITRHLELQLADSWPIGIAKARGGAPKPVAKPSSSDPISTPIGAPLSSDPRISVSTVAAGAFRASLLPSLPTPGSADGPAPSSAPTTSPSGVRQTDDDPLRRAILERLAEAPQDHYQALGVRRDAPPGEIQGAYLRAAKSFHPDRLSESLTDLKPAAAQLFARIAEAQRTLSDAAKRAAYDALLSEGATPNDEASQVERILQASNEFQKAELLMKRGDLIAAEELAHRAVEGDPTQSDYLALRAWIRAQRATDVLSLSVPLKELDRAIQLDRQNDRALFYRGSLYKRLGRNVEAARDFRAAAEANPRNVDAVREVRLHQMRTSAAPPEKKGGFKLFKK